MEGILGPSSSTALERRYDTRVCQCVFVCVCVCLCLRDLQWIYLSCACQNRFENLIEAQEFFWNKRGFRGKIYEECVEFYDIRRHYPEEMVDEYHLLSPGALSVHNELQRSK